MNPEALPLYSAAAVRAHEQRVMAAGVSGETLMRRAAHACWLNIRQRWPQARHITVLCGPGNNGGDGYHIAALAQAAGCVVQLLHVGALPQSGDAAVALNACRAAGLLPQPWHADALRDSELCVDALFGIGLGREISGVAADVVAALNASSLPVVAVDVPSGLDADTGRVHGSAVRAALTVTFIARKAGLYLGQGPQHAGDIVLEDLQLGDIPLPPLLRLLQPAQLRAALPPRKREAHKGDHGHVLLIGGDEGMGGALLLAGRAALRSGAGLVTLATRAAHAAVLTGAQPELMVRGVESAAELAPLMEAADVIAIGPGLGQNAWGRRLFAAALEHPRLQLVDADALNLLAKEPAYRPGWVLTPHPGEAARLLDCGTAQIQADRPAAARALQARYGGSVVLKGAGSLIADAAGDLWLCRQGNPGMAVAGMGDVLSGVIAALLAQGFAQPAALGVLAHALAGDRAARGGERGLTAGDLIGELRAVVNP